MAVAHNISQIQNKTNAKDISSLEIAINRDTFKSDWHRIGSLADRISYFVSEDTHSEQYHIISTVANELLENAVYHSNTDTLVSVALDLSSDELVLTVSNDLSDEAFHRFSGFVRTILHHDAASLYLQRLQNRRNLGDHGGIGLLMLKKDYTSSLRFIFKNGGSTPSVSVRAHIALQ